MLAGPIETALAETIGTQTVTLSPSIRPALSVWIRLRGRVSKTWQGMLSYWNA